MSPVRVIFGYLPDYTSVKNNIELIDSGREITQRDIFIVIGIAVNGCIARISVNFPYFRGLEIRNRDKMILESGSVISRYPANQNTVPLGWYHPQNRVARSIKTVFSKTDLEMEMRPGSIPRAPNFPNYSTSVHPLTDDHIDLLHVGIDGVELLILITEVVPNGDSDSIRIIKVFG